MTQLAHSQHGEHVFHLDVYDGLIHKNISRIHQDADGFLWLSSGNQLQRYDGSNFLSFDYFNDPKSEAFGDILSITHDVEGVIWIGTDGGGLSKIEHGVLTKTYKTQKDLQGLNNNSVETLLSLPDGTLMIGTWGGGINVLKDGQWDYLVHNNSDLANINSQKISELYYDEDQDRIWVGTWEEGLFYIENSNIHSFINPKADDERIRSIISIDKTSDGSIWVASSGDGLYRILNDQTYHYTYKSGEIGTNDISALNAAGDSLWIGSYGGGVSLYSNNKFVSNINQLPIYEQVVAEFVHSISSDDKDNLWLATYGEGVIKLNIKKDLEHIPQVQITSISQADSVIYFPGKRNVPFNKNEAESFLFGTYEASIEIQFSDLELGSSLATYYSYRLEGIQAQWSEPSLKSSLSLHSLKPGNYTFEVRASQDQINWSNPATISFEIPSLWYQTFAFKAAAVLVSLALVFVLVRWRYQLLNKRNEQLQDLVDKKTEEIKLKNEQILKHANYLESANEELEDSLMNLKRLQMQKEIFSQNEKNVTSRELHDSISTNLFKIRQSLSLSLQNISHDSSNEPVQKELDTMIKSLIGDSQIILKNLSNNPRRHASFYDSLKDLVDNVNPIIKSDIKLSWKGDHHINDLKVSSNLFRIIKEALFNSINCTEASLISIFIDNGKNISCTYQDNGHIFDQFNAQKYQNIYKRAEELNAELMFDTKRDGNLIKVIIEEQETMAY